MSNKLKNKFVSNLIKTSRKKWFYTDNLEMSICFFIDCNIEEDTERIINNIKLFLKYDHVDIILIDVCDGSKCLNIFKFFNNFDNVKYFKVEGGFQPEKLSSLLSDKNIVIGVSSNIILNESFFEYIDSNLLDIMTFFKAQDSDNYVLFATSRDVLSVFGFYGDESISSIKKRSLPYDTYNIHDPYFRERSFLDFKVFDDKGEEVDLYNNEIINGMWIGSDLSNVEKLSINSFLKNGHQYHLYVYDDLKGIPDGVVIKDANEIIDGSKIFKYKKMKKKEGDEIGGEGFAGFADWFRYALLYKKGGWWSDVDSVCLKKFEILRPYFFTTFNGTGHGVTNGIIKTQSNSRLMAFCLKSCEEMGAEATWMMTGPTLFLNGFMRHNLAHFSVTEEIFDKVDGGQRLFKGDDIVDISNSYSVHMYNSGISRRGWDKNATFHKDSLFEQLKRKYL